MNKLSMISVALFWTGIALTSQALGTEQESEPPSFFEKVMTKLGLGNQSTPIHEQEIQRDTIKSNKFYDDAVERLTNQDGNAAIIQLRNAIKYDNNNISAYLLLSQIYLDRHDGISAERVLTRAIDNGVDPKYVSKPLAQAYMQQFKFRDLIDNINLNGLPKDLRSELSLIIARAHLGLNQTEKAKHIVTTLLENDPDNTSAKIELALIMSTQNIDHTKRQLEDLPENAKFMADYWFVQSELSRQEGKLNKAIEHLNQALKIQPNHLIYLQTRASLLLDANKLDEGILDISHLRKKFPEDLRSLMLEALYFQKTGKNQEKDNSLKTAYSIIEKLNFLKLQDDVYNLMLIANIYQLGGRLDEAENLLKRYLELKKHDLKAYHLLASIQLAKNQPSLAKITLEKGLKIQNNLSLLLLLAETEMKQGNYSHAAKIYSTIAELNPSTSNIKQRLAFAKLAEGQDKEAIKLLQELIKDEPDNINNRLLLAKIYLGLSDYKNAIQLCEKLISQKPELVAPYHLLGNAYLAQNNINEAKRYFLLSLEKDPNFAPALFNLASIDIKEDKTDAGIKKLQQILVLDAENALAMTQLANIYARTGDTKAEINWREKALKYEADIDSGLRLIELYQQNSQSFHADQTLRSLLQKHPENLKLLAAQAHLSLQGNNSEKAKNIYMQMARIALELNSVEDILNIIRLQRTAGDISNANKTLQKALTENPKNIALIAASAEIDISQNNFKQALEKAQKIINIDPQSPLGYLLAGDSESLLENPKKAFTWYQQGIDKAPAYEPLALAYFRSLRKNDDTRKAVIFLENWLNEHQLSLNVLQALAAGYAQLGQFSDAIKINEQLLASAPNNPGILNNLALLYLEIGDSRALSFAEKAYQLQPDAYAILDTLGWVLTQSGSPQKGLAYLRNASARSFNSPEIQYHYAVALSMTGDKNQAAQVLRQLLGSGKAFSEKDSAIKLLKEIE